MPDFADGINIFGQTEDDLQNTEGGLPFSAKFEPLKITLPEGLSIAATTLTFKYSASPPAAITRIGGDSSGDGGDNAATENANDIQLSGYIYTAAPGDLRVWKKDGDAFRYKEAADIAVPGMPDTKGDFINKEVAYSAAALGFTEDKRTVTFYVEAVTVSTAELDRTVSVEIKESDETKAEHDFSYTVLGLGICEIKEVKNDYGQVTGIEIVDSVALEDSHSAPVIQLSSCYITNPRPSLDGAGVVGDLDISGVITSQLCDIFQAAEIKKAFVFLNTHDEPIAEIDVTSHKYYGDSSSPAVSVLPVPDLAHPYPYFGEFSYDSTQDHPEGIDILPGTNFLRVEASNPKINGRTTDFTGFQERLVEVVAQRNETPAEPGEFYSEVPISLEAASSGYSLKVGLAGVMGTFAVQLRTGSVYKTGETAGGGPILPEAWMVLDTSNETAPFAIIGVPSLGIQDIRYPLVANSSGGYEMALPHVGIAFSGQLHDDQPDQILLTINNWEPISLVETGDATLEFTGDGYVVKIAYRPSLDPAETQVDGFSCLVSSPALGWVDKSFEMEETGLATRQFFNLDYVEQVYQDEATRNFGFSYKSGPDTVSEEVDLKGTTDGDEAGQEGKHLHHHVTEFQGPSSLLERLARDPKTPVMESPAPKQGGKDCFLHATADPAGGFDKRVPRPTVVVLEPEAKWYQFIDLEDFGLDVQGKFLWGFLKGFSMGAWDCTIGAIKSIGGAFWNKATGFLAHPVKAVTDTWKKEKLTMRKAATYARLMVRIVRAFIEDDDQFFIKLANGQLPEFNNLSEEIRQVFECVVEILKGMWVEIQHFFTEALGNTNPVDQGYAFGRIMFEVFSVLVPAAKAGKLGQLGGKLAVLETKFPQLNSIRQTYSELAGRIDTVAEGAANALKPYQTKVPGQAAEKVKRSLTRAATTYEKHKQSLGPGQAKEAFRRTLLDNNDPGGKEWDGFVDQAYKDMCADANGDPSKFPNHKENTAWFSKVGGSVNRKGNAKQTVNGTEMTLSGRTPHESHHGIPKYVQDHLCKTGTTKPDPDTSPAIEIPKQLHRLTGDVPHIHSLINEQQISEPTLRASRRNGVGRKRVTFSAIKKGLLKAYQTAGLDCFAGLAITWLETHFEDCS